MDDQKAHRKIGQGMTEMPEARRFPVIGFNRKIVVIIVAFIAGYALGYLSGRHDGKVSMMKYWLEKTAPVSKAK
jgi:hypothetical protein